MFSGKLFITKPYVDNEVKTMTSSDSGCENYNHALNIYQSLVRLYRRNLQDTSQALADFSCQINVPQFDLLSYICEHPATNQQEIAIQLCVTKGNVSQLLHKLEENGYIKKEIQGRSHLLFPTSKGEDLYGKIAYDLSNFQRSFFNALDNEELATLDQLLTKVCQDHLHK